MTEETKRLTYQEKIEICKQCPFVSSNKMLTCDVCGCPMILKAKIPLFHCPKKRW